MHPGAAVLFLSDWRVGCLDCPNADVDRCEEMQRRPFGSGLPAAWKGRRWRQWHWLISMALLGSDREVFPCLS